MHVSKIKMFHCDHTCWLLLSACWYGSFPPNGMAGGCCCTSGSFFLMFWFLRWHSEQVSAVKGFTCLHLGQVQVSESGFSSPHWKHVVLRAKLTLWHLGHSQSGGNSLPPDAPPPLPPRSDILPPPLPPLLDTSGMFLSAIWHFWGPKKVTM